MKKIISFLGCIFVIIVIIANILCTARIDENEVVTITKNKLWYIILALFLSLFIFWITEQIAKKSKVKEKDKNTKISIGILIFTLIYSEINILIVLRLNMPVIDDAEIVYNVAKDFAGLPSREFWGALTKTTYIQAYNQQISFAFLISLFFRIFNTTSVTALRFINVAVNFSIVVCLFKILKILEERYKINKYFLAVSILTFFTISFYTTYIYNDIISLAFGLWAVYFIMKYGTTDKYRYVIFSSIVMTIAYMFRMNLLIFIIAIVMYLLMNLVSKFKGSNTKQNLMRIIAIPIFVIISIAPTKIIQQYYMNKYNIADKNQYPVENFVLMGIEDKSKRSYGWYDDEIGKYSFENINNPELKTEYRKEIMNRLKYFGGHLGKAADFYLRKIASMWSENTYAAIWINTRYGNYEFLNKYTEPLIFYQKALLLAVWICSTVTIIKTRKNSSNELLLLITIFIGGFLFHIIWEAKSRYIIPYIIILMPVASIRFDNILKTEKIKFLKAGKKKEED